MNLCSFRPNLSWFRSVTKWLMNTCVVNKTPVQKDSLLIVQHWKADFGGESNGYNMFSPDLFKYYCEVFASTVFHLWLPTVFPFCWTLDIQGHEKEALQLMATYLPKDTSPGSAYQEGGGLYALGLIHANHGGDIIDYLLNQLKNASNDVCTGFSNEPLFCWEYPEGCYLV